MQLRDRPEPVPPPDGRLVATPAEMAQELRSFVTHVLAAEPCSRWPQVALDVFNTRLAGGPGLEAAVQQIQRNPLNAVTPVVQASPGSGRPLWLVHGVDGEVGWFLRHLAEAGPRRPVLGLQAPGWYGEAMPGSVLDLAARHLRAIREVQPSGPYSLGGYSAGATLSLHMAALLESEGEQVDELVLIGLNSLFGSAEPVTPADVVFFRLHQLRRRRHPVMAPYFALADRCSDDEVLAGLSAPELPGEPVARRFYRGLLILVGQLCGVPALPPIVTPARCLVLTGDSTGDGGEMLLSELPGLIRGRPTIKVVPGPHARMFEQPYLQRLIADFVAG